ncbi:MAG: septum formation inhibitor Maf [Gammaproteobacteria bacterium]|nr:septum formation inhibitor Maf [Gammaproteobacteria bacterium]
MSLSSPFSPKRLILASSSPFRQELLGRLGVEFTAISPEVDERARESEMPEDLARRLAEAKARRIAQDHPDALIIGSDQVAVLEGHKVGKPGSHAAAVAQLRAASGKSMRFFTALCLLNAAEDRLQTDVVSCEVTFRKLTGEQIESYLRREQPYACAGSFKSEALGIALMERLDGPDPTALIGLPLIQLTRMLENEGMKIL